MSSNQVRTNTYTNEEYFKVLIFSSSEEESLAKCVWLANYKEKLLRKDLVKMPFKNTQLVLYPRWNQESTVSETISYECIIIFVEDQENFDQIKNTVLNTYPNISTRLIVSENKVAEVWGREIKGQVINTNRREEIIDFANKMDEEYFSKICENFKKFDSDQNGYISSNELSSLSKSLGYSSEDELKKAIMTFDINHDGRISLEEFVCWWKLGRNDPDVFSKFYDLQTFVLKKLQSFFNWDSMETELSNSKKENLNNPQTFNSSVDLDTKNLDEYLTRVNFKTYLGESARCEGSKNYLSRYNNKMEFNNDYYIDIAIFVQSCTIKGQSALEYISDFKDKLISIIDLQYIPGFKSFMNKFFTVKIFSQEYSVSIRFELKYDVQELLNISLSDLNSLINFLTNFGKNCFSFDISYFSGKRLTELLQKNLKSKEFLDKCELKIKTTGLKHTVKKFFKNLRNNERFSSFNPLFSSSNLKMKYNGKINEFEGTFLESFLNLDTELFYTIFSMAKDNIPLDLRRIMSRIEIGLNMLNVFSSIQLFSEGDWDQL